MIYKQYIWEEPGFYSGGVILVIASSLEDALIRLKSNRIDCWFHVQIGSPEYYDALLKYSQEQLKNGNIFLIDKITQYREKVLSSKPNPECFERYKNCSDAEILKGRPDFWNIFSQEFLEKNMENHKSKWFWGPTKILDIDEIFIKDPVD